MSRKAVRHPVEMITIGLESGRPARSPANDDVAYALVSRFNVRMLVEKHPRWSHLGRRHLRESAEYESFWLRRLELFERVCIPSVLGLTPQPDAWFIAFGDVDSWYVRELLERLRPYPWIRPYFREKGHPDDAGPLRELLSAFVQSTGKPFLCSTRFDSDDSLHQQFIGGLDLAIAQLRKRGYVDERRCLNFLYGLMQSDGELSVFLRRNNMFQSVFESAGDVIGPYAGGHDEVRERMPLVEIVTNLPMWIYHRHEQTLEPAWVTGRDRLTLPDGASHFASFGLKPARSGDARVNDGAQGPSYALDRRETSEELRNSRYWNASQLDRAVEIATEAGQPAMAQWLGLATRESADPVQVFEEYESGLQRMLNGGQLARLARELDACGETGLALRAFDYAVYQSPSDRCLLAERDELAAAFASLLDIDEQMEIADLAGSQRTDAHAVVIVASAASADGGELERLRECARRLANSGFAVAIMLAPASEQSAESVSIADAASIELLHDESQSGGGSDAAYRALLVRLAERISAIGPSLLVADSSPLAQRLAAAVGRGFGIPVDFALVPGAPDDDQIGL